MWSKAHRLPPQTLQAPTRWRPNHAHPGQAKHAKPEALGVGDHEPADQADQPDETAGPTVEEQLAEAYAQGAADARVIAEQSVLEERKRLMGTITEIASLRRRVLEAADEDLMQLAVGMARRILHREVQLDPDVLLAMAHVALGRLGDRIVAEVHLHPADLAAMSAPPLRDGLTLVPDLDVPRGSCRLTSAQGEIDLGIDAQMTELSRALIGERPNGDNARLH